MANTLEMPSWMIGVYQHLLIGVPAKYIKIIQRGDGIDIAVVDRDGIATIPYVVSLTEYLNNRKC